jgi:hypothetical protein
MRDAIMFVVTVIMTIIGTLVGFVLVVLPTLEPEQKILSNRVLSKIPSVIFYKNADSGINKLIAFLSPSQELIQYIPNWKPSMNFSDDRDQIGIVKKNEKGFTELLKIINIINESNLDADVVIIRESVFMNEQIITSTSQYFWIKTNDKFTLVPTINSVNRLHQENKQIYRNKLLSNTRVLGVTFLIINMVLLVIYILMHNGVIK